MIHYTGASDDYIWLSGLPEDTETLVDAGGIDVLLAPGFTTGASLRNLRSTAEGIEVRTALGFEPSGVTIARDPDSGLPGIEFLEWRGVDFSPSGGLLPVALGTFRIIEDLEERSALPFAYAGTNRAETLDLPGTRLSRDLMNEAYLNGGDDTALLPRGTAYRVFGGNGDDSITARGPLDTELNGDRGDDVLRGAGGDDLILGGRGADLLIGRDGDDFLRGEDPFPFARNGGKDTLRGGDGDDTLAGGFGNDRLIGGAGEDTFHFTLAGGGIDRVLDFDATQDSILFDSDTFPGRFRVRDDGENTHLHWGRFKFAVLKDVVLTADEIDFAQGFI